MRSLARFRIQPAFSAETKPGTNSLFGYFSSPFFLSGEREKALRVALFFPFLRLWWQYIQYTRSSGIMTVSAEAFPVSEAHALSETSSE